MNKYHDQRKGENEPSPSQYPKSKADPANPSKFPQHNSKEGWSQSEKGQKHSTKGKIGEARSS